MEFAEHRISLHCGGTHSNLCIPVKEGDTRRRLSISLSANGRPYPLREDCTAVFSGKKPDGKVVFNECRIELGRVVYEFTAQTTAVPGLVPCEIVVYGADNGVLTSAAFMLFVEKRVYGPKDEVESSNEFTALTKAFSDLEDMREQWEKILASGVLDNSESKVLQAFDFALQKFVDTETVGLPVMFRDAVGGYGSMHIQGDPSDGKQFWIPTVGVVTEMLRRGFVDVTLAYEAALSAGEVSSAMEYLWCLGEGRYVLDNNGDKLYLQVLSGNDGEAQKLSRILCTTEHGDLAICLYSGTDDYNARPNIQFFADSGEILQNGKTLVAPDGLAAVEDKFYLMRDGKPIGSGVEIPAGKDIVKTVNGQGPDKDGNVEIKIPEIGSVSGISVTQYGAIGDGIADDTEAIQTALDACHANGGGTVIIPNGTYLLSDAVRFYSNMKIVGEPGAVLLIGGVMVINTIMRNYYNGSGLYHATENVIIQGLTFDGDGSDSAATLLAFCHARNIRVEGCKFRGGYSTGDPADGGNGHDIEVNSSCDVVISNCSFIDNRRFNVTSELIQIDAATNRECYPWEPDEGERKDDGTVCDSVTISNCLFRGSVYDNALANVCVGAHTSAVSRNIIVENCTMVDVAYGVRFTVVRNLLAQGNRINNAAAGIYTVETSDNVRCVGNVLDNCKAAYPKSRATGHGNLLNGLPVEGYVINPVEKTEDMTQPVGIDENGKLWVAPIGGGGGGDTPVVPGSHGIVWDLVNVSSSSNAVSVPDGMALVAVLTADDGYTLGDVTVTMGGEVLTGVWNPDTATITIMSVTGDVVISCAATQGVDTTAVIAEYNMGYDANGITNPWEGLCVTKIYEFTPDIEGIKASKYYNAENDYVTTDGAYGGVRVYTPSIKYREAGYSTTGMTNKATKMVLFNNGVRTTYRSNSSLTNSTPAEGSWHFDRQNSAAIYSNGFAFSLSILDIDDSYAYWYKPYPDIILPVGVRAGDIIFAGKNTPYYGLANIDGTKVGGEASASILSFDDDIAMNYEVATTSVLGDEPVADTNTAYGISKASADVITAMKKEWMADYAGDYRKIPIIVSTDQHGLTNTGIFNLIGKTFSMHDISKVMNLGDTISEWGDSDPERPLLSNSGLEAWCESVKAIPFSKQLNVFGNHDTWYGNHADEGNPIGTRYPSSQAHLSQYFRNIYARRTNNNGWFVVHDEQFNVKYLVISAFEYRGGVTFRIGTEQMKFIIEEMEKDDGYDIVIVSHVPLYDNPELNVYPTGQTSSTTYRISELDTDALFSSRKTKGSGTITDSDGLEHSYDFSECETELLCSLHGHTHYDAYLHLNGSLLVNAFDWFRSSPFFLVLIDRVNRQLNVWKYEAPDGVPSYQNYQIPFDKPAE